MMVIIQAMRYHATSTHYCKSQYVTRCSCQTGPGSFIHHLTTTVDQGQSLAVVVKSGQVLSYTVSPLLWIRASHSLWLSNWARFYHTPSPHYCGSGPVTHCGCQIGPGSITHHLPTTVGQHQSLTVVVKLGQVLLYTISQLLWVSTSHSLWL